MRPEALLALEDGSVFRGTAIGCQGQTVGEVVFNTAMTGYQEILTDPSYCQQIVTLTYPHVGNVGANSEDQESDRVYASGLAIRDYSFAVSNWRAREPLGAFLARHQVVAIADIDTRRLTRHLRQHGALNGCIMAGEGIDEAEALVQARAFPGLKGMDLAQAVTTDASYGWSEGSWRLEQTAFAAGKKIKERFHVVVYDFGVKRNILRMLVDRGCRVTVVPAKTSAKEALALSPDGIVLSNGPGDPDPCGYAITAIQEFLAQPIPLFGICLGHQLLALASGATTVKLKFGHHGANHPVQDLATGEVLITSQNHGFAVNEKTLPPCLEPTHRSLFDGTLQGIQHRDKLVLGFQGHPEASPGPRDIAPLFDRFITLMQKAHTQQ
ncbi:glutamine-hydrolyzing carbamoyl-phosphate synthase small subunit [Nitrosococcus watsonii]|uniref:Carbamoyl phosphate synthase small chain n=1 Tax=Nitrosococcus watsoni (strain C-113) TaxID=105559 RepID=D8KAX5_NITWC|nr:glutamine-hydrolyzing carbamoyl-phosphate synthase small subunit [Nitrosococcus watsonii]ADJ27509.1 carbamoyl-phosphate synthase, small subunit [Nitrosococcus watsonii C-113]